MTVKVRIIIEPEHPHLQPLAVIKNVPSEDQAYTFGYNAGRDGFWYAVALTQHYRMVYVPPCRIVNISYLADGAAYNLIVAPPQEVDWGEEHDSTV